MSDEKETIEDIVAEMRRLNPEKFLSTPWYCEPLPNKMRSYADRIEAAAKSIEADRDNWRRQALDEDARANAATIKDSLTVGNAAAMSEGGVPRMIRHDLYAKAINGVPRVRLVDGSGKEIYRGYYFAYPEYQGYPIVAEGEKPEEIPLVEGIVTYDPGDWGLSNTPRVLKVTPPHRLELIPEGEL